jgi:hypothetical protein
LVFRASLVFKSDDPEGRNLVVSGATSPAYEGLVLIEPVNKLEISTFACIYFVVPFETKLNTFDPVLVKTNGNRFYFVLSHFCLVLRTRPQIHEPMLLQDNLAFVQFILS